MVRQTQVCYALTKSCTESIEPATTVDRASHETPIDTQDVGNARFDGELTPSNPLPRLPAADGLLKKPSHTG